VATTEKSRAKVLVQRYGWSLDGAQGYVEGQLFRSRPGPKSLPPRLLVGCDAYANGFRAGYFGRAPSHSTLAGRQTDAESA